MLRQGQRNAGTPPPEKGVTNTGNKVYIPPLTSTFKETEISEDLKDRMKWVFRDYGIYLKQ